MKWFKKKKERELTELKKDCVEEQMRLENEILEGQRDGVLEKLHRVEKEMVWWKEKAMNFKKYHQ